MKKVKYVGFTFRRCPGDWRLLPWLKTGKEWWSFSWVFLRIDRYVVPVIDVNEIDGGSNV